MSGLIIVVNTMANMTHQVNRSGPFSKYLEECRIIP